MAVGACRAGHPAQHAGLCPSPVCPSAPQCHPCVALPPLQCGPVSPRVQPQSRLALSLSSAVAVPRCLLSQSPVSLSRQLCSTTAQYSFDCPSHPSTVEMAPEIPQSLGIKGQCQHWVSQGSPRPQPSAAVLGWPGLCCPRARTGNCPAPPGVLVPSPGHAAAHGCCRMGPPWVAAGLGPQAGLFVPPWRGGEQSPAVPVPAGTITKQPHRGHCGSAVGTGHCSGPP